MSKYKIIEVSSDTNIGGAGKCIIALLENFDRERYELKTVLPKDSLLKEHINNLKVPVIEVDGMADKSLDLYDIRMLVKLFKKEKPDIVHTHGCMSARIAAKIVGAKVVYTRHSVFEPSPKISKGLGKKINGLVNNYFADEIIAVAEAAKENLTATGISENKISVILNGVKPLDAISDEQKKMFLEKYSIPKDKPIISIVARLEDIKGHDYFIEAADELLKCGVDAVFVIAGTGSYEDKLKAKVSNLNRQKDIIFTGFISEVNKLMNVTDIQVNASYGTEATSLALLEGMSLGIPAVVSDFGGNPGVITDGCNGYVVPKQNSKLLAEGIFKLLEDKELYQKISKNAKMVYAEKFTDAAMTRNTEKIYNKIVN